MKNTRLCELVFSSLLSATLFAADPVVSNVTLAQDAETGLVTVGYDLANGPAIITHEIRFGGATLWDEGTRGVTGDVNRVVTGDTRHTFVYDPSKGGLAATGAVSAVVSAWTTNDPPDYLTASLMSSQPSNVCFYATTNALPGGLHGNRAYRSWTLVLRRIRAKDVEWTMGTPTGEPTAAGKATCEKPHVVTNTADYFIGVFEVTYSQYRQFSRSSSGNNVGSLRPWNRAELNAIRDNDVSVAGTSGAGSWITRWPSPPYATSWLGKARALTGVAFDIPSESQWEFACRSGIYEACVWNDGTPMTLDATFTGIPGRCAENNNKSDIEYRDDEYKSGTNICGLYPPNKWGLYDMHGNAREIVLDWYEDNITTYGGAVNIDPDNPTNTLSGATVTEIVRKGGMYDVGAVGCRAGCRERWIGPGTVADNGYCGFRVICPLSVFVGK